MNKSEDIAVEVLASNKSLDDDFETLGRQLDALENIDQPTKIRSWMEESAKVTKTPIRDVFIKKAKDFLKKYGENILKETCKWWNENKEKAYGTAAMITMITPFVTSALATAGVALVAGIVAIIVVILIRAGLNTVCPSGKKAVAKLPWM